MLPCCSLVIGNVEQSRCNIPRLIRATENESSRWITPPPLPAGFGDGRPNGYMRCAVNVACFLMQPCERHNKKRNKEPRQPDRLDGTVLMCVFTCVSHAKLAIWLDKPQKLDEPFVRHIQHSLIICLHYELSNSVTLPIGGKGDTWSMSLPRGGHVV